MIEIVVIILGAIAVLGIVAAVAGHFRARKLQRQFDAGEIMEIPKVNTVDMECCGQHETCERDSLLSAVSKAIEYYEDEELDRFHGRRSDEYSEDEANEFRDILYSMRNDEVAGWVRSLQLRAIEMPDAVKDEVFLIVGERRRS